ncbi:MAG: 4-hydroxy-tetrahydrodipicolinate reductase [Oscillospiraceae bacterium]
MIRIIIQGINGRMGKALYSLISLRDDCKVVAGIDVKQYENDVPVFSSLKDVNIKADVLIDFSCPDASMLSLEYCNKISLPMVICTTGFNVEQEEKIKSAAQNIAIFKSANMSLGVNLLIELAQKASTILGIDYDIEIIEKHHNNKVDAPSGTALMLADSINNVNDNKYHYVYDRQSVRAKRDNKEIGIHSIRAGNIVGEHDILFAGQNETITLSHSASSREVFASGAVSAALFLSPQKAGLYTMKDLML